MLRKLFDYLTLGTYPFEIALLGRCSQDGRYCADGRQIEIVMFEQGYRR